MIFVSKSRGHKISERNEKSRKLSEPHRIFVFIQKMKNGDTAVMQKVWRRGIFSNGEWVFIHAETNYGLFDE